ncbi:hypothetical protein PTKIN_Ptkin08bG0013700 [Pterospermum kingtungense]
MAAESGRSNESVVISVGSLVSSLRNRRRRSMLPSNCIFKTPSILFRHKEISFLPNRFSIGPMHHGNQNLVPAEKIKIEYLEGLLSRVIISRSQTMPDEAMEIEQQNILSDWVNAVKKIEKEASACYEGHDYAAEKGDEFAKIMVIDAVFIIELFRKHARQITIEKDDPIFSMSCMFQFLRHDLILLENQIPWLVLETLFEKTKLPSEKSLIELTLHFFDNLFTSYPPDHTKICPLINGHDIKHILDLLRLSLVLPYKEIENRQISAWQPVHSVTRLREAGVKFKKMATDSILDIRFSQGFLEIPCLLIQETTETIFRNLISYEQCLSNCRPIFTSYAKIIDNLIDTTNDMEILCKEEIFDNWLSPEDATQFFNKLYNDTYVKEFYYVELCNKLNAHCNQWWPRWRAAYVHNYFTKPWVIAAQIYAIIMFGLACGKPAKNINYCSNLACI